ncbi:MAG: dihydropteroate synthase [Paludibacteraceae bacterium]|nr:dihydropteroate synthase [Paludibacteraceae bacterium]
MAIGNVTPDSFYASSRLLQPGSEEVDKDVLVKWAKDALDDGAEILDIGACSTRPNSTPVDEATEWHRLEAALPVLREAFPKVSLSLDTFRPEIARRALAQFGRLIINDISGGCEAMFDVVRQADAPYIWTLRGDYELPARHPEMNDLNLILDPGFGFIGSTEADYACMRRLDELRAYNRPILVGVSRKSMVYKPLGLTPDTCLMATQALQLYALEHGATVLRTHDVRATKQIIELYNTIQ